MPGFDGTGPMSMGPRTGGGFGFCPPASGPAPFPGAYPYYGVGRGGFPRGGGRGRAWGGGRGWGWRSYYRPYGYQPGYQPPAPFYPPPPEDELEFLRGQAQGLQEELESVRKRMAELEQVSKPPQE